MSPRRKTKYRSSELKSDRAISKEIIIRHLQILLCRLQVYFQFTTVPQKINVYIYVNDNYNVSNICLGLSHSIQDKSIFPVFFL